MAILGAVGIGIGIGAGIWKEEDSNSEVSSTTEASPGTTADTTLESTTSTLPNDGIIEYESDVFGTLRGLRPGCHFTTAFPKLLPPKVVKMTWVIYLTFS